MCVCVCVDMMWSATVSPVVQWWVSPSVTWKTRVQFPAGELGFSSNEYLTHTPDIVCNTAHNPIQHPTGYRTNRQLGWPIRTQNALVWAGGEVQPGVQIMGVTGMRWHIANPFCLCYRMPNGHNRIPNHTGMSLRTGWTGMVYMWTFID